ncbi:hypothetical protein BSL78_17482 [Apostichopus japonicus]|uniref:Uncharacterized protein n=1 Tax=Stichopus japonicus TaxID=307972 RepID=A0A2G8KCE1_STIJA|nr:hypothetical protein BSL78_17482 [Apostichopus japonicus]
MELIKLSLSLLIHMSLAGDLHGSHTASPKPFNIIKQKISLQYAADRPRSLDKRSRILKFGKYDHAGRCLFGKCDQFGSKSTLTFEEGVSVGKFRPKSIQLNSHERDETHNDSVEATLTESETVSKDSSKLQQGMNYHNTTNTEILSVQHKFGARRGRRRRIFRRDSEVNSSETSRVSSESPKENNRTGNAECITEGGCEGGNSGSRLPYELDGDAYMAFGSLGFLLTVLTSAVLYTGLWKKRNTMLYPDFIDRERSSSRRKTDIKALLKAKLGKIPVRSRRIKDRLGRRGHNHNRRYLTLPLVENGEAGMPDDDSDDSRGERISEEEEEDEEEEESETMW